MRNPFRYFNSSPEVIRLVVMMYIRYPLSLRRSGNDAFIIGRIRNGVGTWTKSLYGSMAKRIISGVPLITKVRCLRSSRRSAEIVWLR